MDSLKVETAENGFVVYEGDSRERDMIGKTWAFESAQTLADFMQQWGKGNTKTTSPETAAKGI